MNNDELQKAIDDITRDNAMSADSASASDATTENDQLAAELTQPTVAAPATEAEVEPVTSAPDFGVAPAPVVPDAPGMPPVDVAEVEAQTVAPEAPKEPEIVTTAPAIEPAPVEAPAETNVADKDTLEAAMKELYPLLDRVSLPIEEKFDITLKYGEPAKALELAKQIADDTSKANALMKIIEKLK